MLRLLRRCRFGGHRAAADAMPSLPSGKPPATPRLRLLPAQLCPPPCPPDRPLPRPSSLRQVHCDEGPGDILVFLTGQDEIESCARLLVERAAAMPPPDDAAEEEEGEEGEAGGGKQPRHLQVLPIYAALPPEQQLRVFQPAPPGTRKVRGGGWGLGVRGEPATVEQHYFGDAVFSLIPLPRLH